MGEVDHLLENAASQEDNDRDVRGCEVLSAPVEIGGNLTANIHKSMNQVTENNHILLGTPGLVEIVYQNNYFLPAL